MKKSHFIARCLFFTLAFNLQTAAFSQDNSCLKKSTNEELLKELEIRLKQPGGSEKLIVNLTSSCGIFYYDEVSIDLDTPKGDSSISFTPLGSNKQEQYEFCQRFVQKLGAAYIGPQAMPVVFYSCKGKTFKATGTQVGSMGLYLEDLNWVQATSESACWDLVKSQYGWSAI